RFWNASGLSVRLGGAGLEIRMESLRAVILGGISFRTPKASKKGAPAAENHEFPLFADREAADAASYTRKITAVSYLPGSVQGLAMRPEVTTHGLKIGGVTAVQPTYSSAENAIVAPVRYEVQPERIVGIGRRAYKTDAEAVDALLKRGLRASLQSTSL